MAEIEINVRRTNGKEFSTNAGRCRLLSELKETLKRRWDINWLFYKLVWHDDNNENELKDDVEYLQAIRNAHQRRVLISLDPKN